jgi:4-hydroxyacetophenone monooxygenase
MGSISNPRNNSAKFIDGYDVDEAFVRKGLKEVDSNALRLALYQITRDAELESISVLRKEFIGGGFIDYVLSDADAVIVREKAVNYFLQGKKKELLSPLSKTEAFRMMDLFSDVPLSSSNRAVGVDYEEGYEQLAFEEYPREVKWTDGALPQNAKDWKVAIIGAGVSGIAAAISLQRLGIAFDIIERQSGIGGTWRLNRYPNVRVDSLAFLYQYTFTKKYTWSEYFPTGGEILQYLEYVAGLYNINEKCKFDTEVIEATWDEAASKWLLTLEHKTSAVKETAAYNVIVSCGGLFSTPNLLPDIKGIASFKGPIFHTSQWPTTAEYEDKNIALIGTGSTGTQLAPALAASAKHLTVYQRTANWIVPFESFKDSVTPETDWVIKNFPHYWNWYVYGSFFKTHDSGLVQYRDAEWVEGGGKVSKLNDSVRSACVEFIKSKLGDREDLMQKVIPKGAPFVRRMVVDNGFYDAIKQDNVELVTDSVSESPFSFPCLADISTAIDTITDEGIRMKSGEQKQFDLIVLGAGFNVGSYFWPVEYTGRSGMTLEKSWEKDGARSYLGMCMKGFPNMFTLYGPNHQPRGGSLPSFAEIWARYMVQGVVGMIEKGAYNLSALHFQDSKFC